VGAGASAAPSGPLAATPASHLLTITAATAALPHWQAHEQREARAKEQAQRQGAALERQLEGLRQQLASAAQEAAEQRASGAAALQGLRDDLSRAQAEAEQQLAEAEQKLAAAQAAAERQQQLLQAQVEQAGLELRDCREQQRQQGEQQQRVQHEWRRDRELLVQEAQVGRRQSAASDGHCSAVQCSAALPAGHRCQQRHVCILAAL
jgi:hypothetical protein